MTGMPVCTQTVTGSLLFGSPHRLVRVLPIRRCFFIGGVVNLRRFQLADDGPGSVYRAVHAYLLVTFDCFFFSSGLIGGTVITATGILFARGRFVLGRYRQCLTYSGTLAFVFFCCLVRDGFRSSDISNTMEEAGPSLTYSAPLAKTFLRLSLDLASDQLYDLPPEIPNIMGLRALRASAAIVKVMSVPDSRSIRVVAADDHVKIGFHG